MTYEPEVSNKYTFKYDKSFKIKDLVLAKKEDTYLLSILKNYSNGEYFGSTPIFLINNEVVSLFKCKDRGFTEEVVNDEDKAVEFALKNILPTITNKVNTYSNFEYKTQDINLEGVDEVVFCYLDSVYQHTNMLIDGSYYRGLYGNESDYKSPSFDDLENLRLKSKVSFSNVYHETQTEYSQIKVFLNGT